MQNWQTSNLIYTYIYWEAGGKNPSSFDDLIEQYFNMLQSSSGH